MGKHEQNAIIYLLCVVIGILLVLLFFFLLEGMKMDARLNHSRKEHDKSALVLREQREKMERLLKQLKEKEE